MSHPTRSYNWLRFLLFFFWSLHETSTGRVEVVEPRPEANREVSLQPFSPGFEGYHRPAINHPIIVVYGGVYSWLLSVAALRLYSLLVGTQQLVSSPPRALSVLQVINIRI